MSGATLELLVREGCHLCDDFLLQFSLDQPALVPRLAVLDVDADVALATEFGLRVPVLRVGGQVACEGRYDRAEIAAALRL